MSLYNLINGVTSATFFIMPMLGERHPETYPRFRDCFLSDEEHPEYNDYIHVYTRVGGVNRDQGFGESELYAHPNFVATFDDSFDSTYATYVFSVPEQWREDFQKFKERRISDFSIAYQTRCRIVWPKLQAKFDEIWQVNETDKRKKLTTAK